MDSDIIAQMRKEEADLARKLRAVRDFLAAYDVNASNESAPAPTRPAKVPTQAREKVGIEGFSDYGRGVVAAAMRELLPASHPIKTRLIVEVLQQKGVAISGKDPVNALGAMLYRSADIVSHGKAGWTLADSETAKEIVGKYAPKENDPREEIETLLGGPDAAEASGPTPGSAMSYSTPWRRA
jgi:hypothetical protein